MTSFQTQLTLILACGLGTYLWRGLGVWLADRLNAESRVFRWVTAVAYAMLAGLVARMLILPQGVLAQTASWERLGAAGLGVGVYFLCKRNVLAGIVAAGLCIALIKI